MLLFPLWFTHRFLPPKTAHFSGPSTRGERSEKGHFYQENKMSEQKNRPHQLKLARIRAKVWKNKKDDGSTRYSADIGLKRTGGRAIREKGIGAILLFGRTLNRQVQRHVNIMRRPQADIHQSAPVRIH